MCRLLPPQRIPSLLRILGRLRNRLVAAATAAVVAAEFDCPDAYCFDLVGLGFADFGTVVLFRWFEFLAEQLRDAIFCTALHNQTGVLFPDSLPYNQYFLIHVELSPLYPNYIAPLKSHTDS